MENDDYLYFQIRNEFQRGATKEEAFKNIGLQQGIDLPPDLTISSWLKRAYQDDLTLEEEIGEEHYYLLFSIIGQYTKFTYAIFHREVPDYGRETFILNRFNLVVKGSMFEIFDSYNEESRILPSTIIKPAQDSFYFPTMLTHDQMLLNMGGIGTDHLFLLEIDFNGKNFSVLDKTPLDFVCYEIVVDSMGSMRFLIQESQNGHPLIIRIGQVVEGRILIQRQQIEFGVELFYCKLVNEKLFAFHPNGDNPKFVEYELKSNQAFELNEFFFCDDLVPYLFETDQQFIWSDNKLYVACQIYGDFPKILIVLFDVNSHTWSKAEFIGAGEIGALTIDEDEILIISATEDRYEEDKPTRKTVYHIPMRKPDKLCYIAWKKIRRQALFFGSRVYEKFLPRLPFNSEFRLFAEEG